MELKKMVKKGKTLVKGGNKLVKKGKKLVTKALKSKTGQEIIRKEKLLAAEMIGVAAKKLKKSAKKK